MLKSLKELYSLLTSVQRKKLLRLQVLVVLMSFGEIASVVSIGPFMALVGDMSRLEGDGLIANLYDISNISDPKDFLFWMGVGVLMVLTLAAVISALTIWRLSMYGARVGAELSSRLFQYYMYRSWLFHASGSSSALTNQIAQECLRVTNNIINPFMQMNAKLVMALMMAVSIFIYNPIVALVGIAVFVLAYLALYRTVRMRLIVNGKRISESQNARYKLMSEGFGGIKDVLLLGRQGIFVDRFDKESKKFANALGKNQSMSQVPRYAMELVAFGSVIFLILYLLVAYENNLGAILPILSVYALAGFKLLPAFQQVYTSMSQIRGNIAAFEAIRNDLLESQKHSSPRDCASGAYDRLRPTSSISIRNVTFYYPGKAQASIVNLSIEMPVNQVIGLVGASGSGKSTAIDIILGLIKPYSGTVYIDDHPLMDSNTRSWQNSLGFVPQSIFLSDATVKENIAFGLPPEAIDHSRLDEAVKMAHLEELIRTLPEGLNTKVGERGVQLSGGQRQRIGIARALYHDADVLILDEATSALDGITEKLIMDAIHDFSGKKTIIMIAHRLATVKKCDRIFLMEHGTVIDAGSYDDLATRNDIFKKMTKHA